MKCAGCEHDNPPGARFCNNCGSRFQAAGPGLAPGAYTPRHLAEKILTSRSALEGERKQVTVLFADLKGSMELLADRDPEESERARGVPLRIRIGINSGEVVVRSIGSDLDMDYTAVGQTTHLAARMEQMADPNSAFVTPGTLRLAGDAVITRSLGLRPVKGLDAPLEIHELVGAAPARALRRATE